MPNVRIPLVGSPTNRDDSLTTDQRFVNCFPEVIKNNVTENQRIYLTKRNGTTKYKQPAGAIGVGRGVYAWNGQLWTVIGNTLWSTNLSTGVSTSRGTLSTSTGYCGFTEATDATDGLVVILSDGTDLWYIKSDNTATKLSSGSLGYPTPHYPCPVYLDGYIFIQKIGNAAIYQSPLNNPNGTWNATEFVTPEQFPDAGRWLARQNNTVVSLGESSIEFYYDAANATGSVLSVNSQYTIQFGCASGTTVAQQEGLLVFVAQSTTGGYFVVAVDGFSPHNISNTAIEKLLEAEAYESGTALDSTWGYTVRSKGHLFYVLNLPEVGRTVVYDFETKMWHEWDFQNNSDNNAPTFGIFPMIGMGDADGQTYFLHSADGWVYFSDPFEYSDAYVDANTYKLVRVFIQTGRFDGDTQFLKIPTRMELVADRPGSTATMYVQFSDDDYQTWHPSTPRQVNLNTRSYLYRIGNFRRRAFKMWTYATTKIRLEAMEMEIAKGTH